MDDEKPELLKPSIYKPQAKLYKDVPEPPPLPKYDPNEEAPLWNSRRVRWNLPVAKPVPWTKVGVHPESDDDPDWRGVIRSKVIEYPMPEPYNLNDFKDKPAYYYFDTPDYADPFKKLAWSAKFFFKIGALAALIDVNFSGKLLNLSSSMRLFNKYVVPCWFAGMAASATAITVSNLRGKKDDYWNYAAAGQAAAMVFGRKLVLHWVRSTAICMPLALLAKYVNEENVCIYPSWNFRTKSSGLSGMNNENGFFSGDLRFGFRARNYGDPGRDVEKRY